jgi:hypothetical protein
MNSFFLYIMTSGSSCTPHGIRQLNYRTDFLQHLIRTFMLRKWSRQEEKFACRYFARFLYLETITDCALCIQRENRTPSGHEIQPFCRWKQCDLPLFPVGCFMEHCKERDVEIQKLRNVCVVSTENLSFVSYNFMWYSVWFLRYIQFSKVVHNYGICS